MNGSTSEHRCAVCREPIVQPPGSGRRRTTCSDRCRQALRRYQLRIAQGANNTTPSGMAGGHQDNHPTERHKTP